MNVLTGTTSAGMGSTVIMLVLMIAIFYFMLIRPENKRKKEAEQMRGAVKKGDKIVTIGGIAGVVVDVKESRIVVETSADQVRIELEKWAISSNETATEAAKAEAKKAQEAKAKAKADAIREAIKEEMVRQNTEELSAGAYIVRYTSIISNRFDSTTFKRLYADLYKDFTKPVSSRRFSVSC